VVLFLDGSDEYVGHDPLIATNASQDTQRFSMTETTGLGRALLRSKPAQLGEIVVLFGVALAVIAFVGPLAGDNPIAGQGVVWVANVLMLATVWLGLRLRGQGWDHFGLRFRGASRRIAGRAVLISLVVFVAAIAAFLVGTIVMANIVGIPEGADMSGYNYLSGNLPMLILALVGVYIVSSFGEEVVYRAFLINRIAELGGGGKAAWRVAVLISSVVFGLAHYAWGVTGIVQTAFMGLALGVAYLVVGRNLWVMILAHAYMDTILMVQMYFAGG
jgi:membrane protease YdiL (CAAX protease family)